LRKIAAFLCVLALAGCGAIPFSTMWKMRNFSAEDVLALHPPDLRVAVALDATARINPNESNLVLVLEENGARQAYPFALQPASDAAAPDADHSWTIMQPTPASAARFAALQARLRGHVAQAKFAEFSWQGGLLGFGKGKSMPALLHLSVDLRLHAHDDWLPLLVDYPMRVNIDRH